MCQVSILCDTHSGMWIIQTVKSRMSIVSEKVHRLDPPHIQWLQVEVHIISHQDCNSHESSFHSPGSPPFALASG